jgi:hypothetical protein
MSGYGAVSKGSDWRENNDGQVRRRLEEGERIGAILVASLLSRNPSGCARSQNVGGSLGKSSLPRTRRLPKLLNVNAYEKTTTQHDRRETSKRAIQCFRRGDTVFCALRRKRTLQPEAEPRSAARRDDKGLGRA